MTVARQRGTLDDVAEIVTGTTPPTLEPSYYGGTIPFVTPAELDAEDPLTTAKVYLSASGAERGRLLPKESVLVSCIGSLGKVGIAGVPVVTNQQINALVFNADRVFPRYGYHFCRTLKPTLERIAPSTTLKIVNKSRFSELSIPLPSISEQRRIAAILDKADQLRTLRRQAVGRLLQVCGSVFVDMFGDPVANEKGWRIVSVADFVASFEGGKNIVSADEEHSNSPYRVLKVSAVTSLEYRPTESKPVPDEYTPTESHFVRAGDLLFSRANTTDLVGATAYVFTTPPNLLLPDKIWRFVWRSRDEIDPFFVWFMFQHPKFRYEIGKRATGTSGSMKNISQEKVFSMRAIMPPVAAQRRFGLTARSVANTLTLQQESATKLDTLFSSLQHRAFQGDL